MILCDIGLPGMDGYAVARSLRDDPATREIRLVALTGYGRDSTGCAPGRRASTSTSIKPVEPLELKRLLDEWG